MTNFGDFRLTVFGQFNPTLTNYRQSAIIGVMERLQKNKIKIIIYEDMLEEISRNDYEVTHDIGKFKQVADIIIANRYADEIMDVKPKVYCRDIFSRD